MRARSPRRTCIYVLCVTPTDARLIEVWTRAARRRRAGGRRGGGRARRAGAGRRAPSPFSQRSEGVESGGVLHGFPARRLRRSVSRKVELRGRPVSPSPPRRQSCCRRASLSWPLQSHGQDVHAAHRAVAVPGGRPLRPEREVRRGPRPVQGLPHEALREEQGRGALALLVLHGPPVPREEGERPDHLDQPGAPPPARARLRAVAPPSACARAALLPPGASTWPELWPACAPAPRRPENCAAPDADAAVPATMAAAGAAQFSERRRRARAGPPRRPLCAAERRC